MVQWWVVDRKKNVFDRIAPQQEKGIMIDRIGYTQHFTHRGSKQILYKCLRNEFSK